MIEKEYCYIPKKLAKKLNELEGTEALNNEILYYIDSIKNDLKVSLESMDEDILLYRASMIKARDAFKKAKDEELAANYELWEKYEDELQKTRIKIDSIRNLLKPLNDDIVKIDRNLNSITSYTFNGFMDILNKLTCMDSEQRNMINFLIKNFNSEQDNNK